MQRLSMSFLLCVGWFSNAAALSLQEKVGQILMVHVHAEYANEDARMLIQEIGVGGIIYYPWANGLTTPQQVRSLSTSLQALTRSSSHQLPLFIAIDQEGGVVNRLVSGFTHFPSPLAVAMTHPDWAEQVALASGKELAAVGINMNLAPVADVNSNPLNPVIGTRAFGSNPEQVIAYGNRYLLGYHAAGLMTTLKHFPGHGDTATDSHHVLPVVSKSLEQLEEVELKPFRNLASSTDCIMTAHIVVPSLDPVLPATLSETVLSHLRKSIGFDGIIITDSLVMKGALATYQTVEETAIQALKAGCDVILVGGRQMTGGDQKQELTPQDIRRIHTAIIQAVLDGRLQESRIDAAFERIVRAKSRLSIQDPQDEEVFPTHESLAYDVAVQALRVTGSIPTSLDSRCVVTLAPRSLERYMTAVLPPHLSQSCTFFSLNAPSKYEEELEMVRQAALKGDVLVVISQNAWKYPTQRALIRSVIDRNKPVILIASEHPSDKDLFPEVTATIATSSPTASSLRAAYERLDLSR